MSALLALLQQQGAAANVQTRKGLVILGLQNDFVLPQGKLPVADTAFLDRILDLVPRFRAHGDVLWVKTHASSDAVVAGVDLKGDTVIVTDTNDGKVAKGSSKNAKQRNKGRNRNTAATADDPELFLGASTIQQRCCIAGSSGAEWADRIKSVQQSKDFYLTKTQYSAFEKTSLLMTLRSKLITEIFVVGCLTNISVYATAVDAASSGMRVVLVEDCLGYRVKRRHDQALSRLRDIMEAETITVEELIDELQTSGAEKDLKPDPEIRKPQHVQESISVADRRDIDVRPRSTESSVQKDESELIAVDSEVEDDEAIILPSVRLRDSVREYRATSNPSTPTAMLKMRSTHSRTSGEYRSPQLPKMPPASSNTTPDGQSPQPSPETQATPTKIATHVPEPATEVTKPCATSRGIVHTDLDELANDLESKASISGPESTPLFGVEHEKESEKSRIFYNLLPASTASGVFDAINTEITWQKMYHQQGEVPRLVCCQATVNSDDHSTPVYRHPSDQTLPTQSWTPVVDQIRRAAQDLVGHPLNHALIQLYRSGVDNISEHSDKTLDIVPDSHIVNVSLGAQRTMRLRTKRGPRALTDESPSSEAAASTRTTFRVPMPHNSMIAMTLRTNARYLHGINADKRLVSELTDAERAYDGQRISLTFRQIGTYISSDAQRIWGQGAVSKGAADARPVVNGDEMESSRMLKAFGAENATSTIVWEEIYGSGFDVLHLKSST